MKKNSEREREGYIPCEFEEEIKADKSGKIRIFPVNKFDFVFLCICLLYIIVMLSSGFNFLPLIAAALACAAGILIAVKIISGRGISFWLLAAYLTTIIGTFLYFLIWSAEPFGKRLWWNLVLIIFPVTLALTIKFAARIFKTNKAIKITTACMAFLMAGTAVAYLLCMNLRIRPVVDRMWEGQEEYLNSLRQTPAGDGAPNVLVILMDDMAYADISSYSYMESGKATINTPNIDSIADRGIMMDNFYAASPVCSPSRFSLLTGRYSSRGYLDNVVFPTTTDAAHWSPTHFVNPYQFLNNVDGILGDEITLAEALKAVGYRTGCIGKWNLGDYGEYLPTNQGFDYFYGSHYVNDMTPYNWVREENGKFEEIRTSAENADQSESTKYFTAEMRRFISSSVENDEKFFAYYTTPWPHYPIFSGEKYNTSDDNYIDCIEEFDRGLGEIFQDLKDAGVYDDTLIIFTSDNGPGREGVTGALRGRKNTTFDGGMKVPLLVSYPNGGVGRGAYGTPSAYNIYKEDGTVVAASTKRLAASSMNIDLMPTILEFAGVTSLPADRIIDGKSAKALWTNTVPDDTRIHDALFYLKKGKCQGIQMPVEVETETNGVKTKRTYDFKYYDKVRTENSAFIDQVYKNYLFNLDTDPAEGYNISMVYPEVADKLFARLEAFRKEMKTNRRGIL